MSRIAVVIPCFNLGRFVEEALASVLRQTLPAAEVVIVDDGSTDVYTRERLDALNRAGTRVVSTPNRGVGAARNHGIRLTSAEYLVVLDADDRLLPEYLARTAARLDAEPDLGFVTTAIQAFGDAGYTWTPPAPAIANALVRGSAHPASLFRRQVWSAIGGFDESSQLQGCEDLDFWLCAMERGVRGGVIDEPLLEYRVRADSLHQRLVASGGQRHVMDGIFRKHRDTIEAIGPDLLIEKDRFLEEQRTHHASLLQRRTTLAEELHRVDADVARAREALARRGSWGEIDGVSPFHPLGSGEAGRAIDRFYARSFLRRHTADRRGEVLVVQDGHVGEDLADHPGGSLAPAVGTAPGGVRLVDLPGLNEASADCIVAGDALASVWDVACTLAELARVLRPGGVLLCVLPAARALTGSPGDTREYWRFTEAAARYLLAQVFPPEAFTVEGYGNVMVCAAALAGRGLDGLTPEQRDTVDPMFPLLYGVRAVKPSRGGS